MERYNRFNFYRYSYCEFEMKEVDFFTEMNAHFQSRSNSYYYYTDKGVYRYSNHWGRVASCRWKIKGIEDYKNQNYYVGYANWSDFYPLNDVDRVFYLEVDFKIQQVNILRKDKDYEDDFFLMTSDFAHQRLKQIQTLFKEYKWAKYFDDDIDVLREKLITGLIASNKSIQELKQQL